MPQKPSYLLRVPLTPDEQIALKVLAAERELPIGELVAALIRSEFSDFLRGHKRSRAARRKAAA